MTSTIKLKRILKFNKMVWTTLFLGLTSCNLWQTYNEEISDYGLPPVSAQAHFYSGLIEEGEENWRQAAEHFDKASNEDPRSARIYMHLARCLIFLKRYGKGIRSLKMAQKFASAGDYLIWFDIGQTYEQANMHLAARKCYEKAIAIYPKFQKAKRALVALEKNM